MAVSTPFPASGISLHGFDADMDSSKHLARSAILLKLSQSVLDDFRKACSGQAGLQFVTGKAPKFQLGSRSIDLSVSPDIFRNELFASPSPTEFDFDSVITHRAELNADHSKQVNTAGADAALAALRNTLASYEQEKKAKQTTISDNVLPEYRNRFEAARKQKRGGLLGMHSTSGGTSPSLSGAGTPRAGLAATSAPTDSAIKTQAMRMPIIHLLAMKPTTTEEIVQMTRIPRGDLEPIVSKIAQHVDGKWELMGKVYKELDVWAFGYRTQEDRQMAVDNAIRAFDRQRIGKEDKLWQMLLPKEERGKGKVLSKLHIGANQPNKGLTPNWMPSPNPQVEDDDRLTGTANTPRLAPSAGTPKHGAAKSSGVDMKKRLLAKDPKKARAAEEAKEKKKKKKREREVVASDRESGPVKRQKQAAVTSKVPSKVKSAELVHDSDDDDDDDDGEEGEIKETPSQAAPKASQNVTKPATKPRSKASDALAPDGNSNHAKANKPAPKSSTLANKPRNLTPLNKSTASPAVKPARSAVAGKSTPQMSSGLSAPATQAKSQLSPSKSSSRPPVPSPLGAARSRVASDVSDRSGIAMRKTKQGAETPKGLGITTGVNGVRKRQDTVTSRDSLTSADSDRKKFTEKTAEKPRKTAPNSTPAAKASNMNGPLQKVDAGIKRKACGAPSQSQQATATKHRKTESTSSASQRSHSSSTATVRTIATNHTSTSPDATFDSGSSDSAASQVMEAISYNQGVNIAQKFREEYYPQYAKMYDDMAEREASGESIGREEREQLWRMHRRLESMKREIATAAARQGRE